MSRDGDPAVWPLLEGLPRREAAGAVLRRAACAPYALAEVALQLGHDRRARALRVVVTPAAPGFFVAAETTVILAAVTFYLSGGAADLMSGESSPWVLGPLPVAVLLCWFSVAAWATQTFRDRPR